MMKDIIDKIDSISKRIDDVDCTLSNKIENNSSNIADIELKLASETSTRKSELKILTERITKMMTPENKLRPT